MKKIDMRHYVSTLETRIDETLKKWKKVNRIENGEVVQIEWQFEQSHVSLDIFWRSGDEHVELECRSPRAKLNYEWKGLTEKTIIRVMDRVGNFAQVAQWKGRL